MTDLLTQRSLPRVRLIREGPAVAPVKPRIKTPADAFRLMRPVFEPEVVECFYAVTLDTQNQATAAVLITRGILNSSLVHPREVFRAAIQAGAAGVILAHNHPSGDPEPSADDRVVTRQMVEAGRMLNILVYDHLIFGDDRYFSFAEAEML